MKRLTLLLMLLVLPLHVGAAQRCVGYTDLAVVAIAKARDEMVTVRSQAADSRNLAVALLGKLRAVEDHLIACGMSADQVQWRQTSEALQLLAVSAFPLRDLIVSGRFSHESHWVQSDQSLFQAVRTLQMKKADIRKY